MEQLIYIVLFWDFVLDRGALEMVYQYSFLFIITYTIYYLDLTFINWRRLLPIKVWFKNRRAKYRKKQKARQGEQSNISDKEQQSTTDDQIIDVVEDTNQNEDTKTTESREEGKPQITSKLWNWYIYNMKQFLNFKCYVL